ncbi:MAG: hypothetical protein JWQ25_1290, partial [Daejeonella sp.]|nr:hypothetical protein [Daejeonella sp.]
REFIPNPERADFVDWINSNIDWVFDDFKKQGGELSESWLFKNKNAIERNEWDDLFIPRYIFGLYIKEKVTTLLKAAVESNTIDYTVLRAKVTNISKGEKFYKIIAVTADKAAFILFSTKVVLSIGSPPKHKFDYSTAETPLCIINDIYDPKLSHNIKKIRNTLLQSDKVDQNNILVIGSNASALEAIYNLNDCGDINNLVNKFYIVSSAGTFPSRINKNIIEDYQPQYLTLLKYSKNFTSKKILEAVKKDVALAETNKINISDTFNSISQLVIELLNRLNSFQQKRFVSKYGVEIGKYQRRAGNEYLDVVETLKEQNKLEILKGRFIKRNSNSKSELKFNYLDKANDSIKAIESCIKVVIDCTGFQQLTSASSSSLIRNLITQQVCVTNESRNGFKVNENFEANKNLFIMGPLLAGNLNKNLRIWHAESCSRIISLSKQLASILHHYHVEDKALFENSTSIPYQVAEQG